MWRPFFLGIGITLLILGAECLVLDHVVLNGQQRPLQPGFFQTEPTVVDQPGRLVSPPEWAPWTLMSAGAVVMLYSFTIPMRVAGE